MTKNVEYGKFLYLGCGNHRMANFTHVEMDIGKRKSGPPDIIANITQHINLPDKSVDLIFSRATMEHLTYTEFINCLLENFRLLRKDGVVRMLVPDFDIMIHDYLNHTPPLGADHREMEKYMPLGNHTDYFVARALYHDHYYLHNFDTLSRALAKCGFVNIRKAFPGDTIVTEVRDILHDAEVGRDRWEVIVEAQKGDLPPIAKRTEQEFPRNFVAYLLAKYFNIRLISHVKRKPMFPTKKWFAEKALKIYNPYRGEYVQK